MKKVLSLIIILALCLSLCACGSKGNPDHEYIVTLLEKGEYDMAIDLIKLLKERDGGAVQSVPAPAEAPVQTEAPASVGSELADLAIKTVNDFMAGTGGEMARKHMEISGEKENPIQVSHAMEYTLANYDDNNSVAHLLLINLVGWFHYDDGAFDSIQLVLDFDSGFVVDTSSVDWDMLVSLHGNFTELSQFQMTAISAYISYLNGYNASVWSDMEIINELSDSELAAVNEALNY